MRDLGFSLAAFDVRLAIVISPSPKCIALRNTVKTFAEDVCISGKGASGKDREKVSGLFFGSSAGAEG
jgi:hypothetical protein